MCLIGACGEYVIRHSAAADHNNRDARLREKCVLRMQMHVGFYEISGFLDKFHVFCLQFLIFSNLITFESIEFTKLYLCNNL